MIAVFADKRGEKYRLLVQGHAGAEGCGDLVCAAVSALTGTLLSYAKSNPRCRTLRTSEASGIIFLSCRGGLAGAFEMVMEGLLQLAASYPKNIYPVTRVVDDNKTVRWYNASIPAEEK